MVANVSKEPTVSIFRKENGAESSSEMLETTYQTTYCHIAEEYSPKVYSV
jgi:hypothetical protein